LNNNESICTNAAFGETRRDIRQHGTYWLGSNIPVTIQILREKLIP